MLTLELIEQQLLEIDAEHKLLLNNIEKVTVMRLWELMGVRVILMQEMLKIITTESQQAISVPK